jgi:hypothetical protein
MSQHEDPRFYQEHDGDRFGRLLDFLNRLDRSNIHYRIDHDRPDSVRVDVSLPGELWEVEFMADGLVDIERFRSVAGVETDPAILEELFRA